MTTIDPRTGANFVEFYAPMIDALSDQGKEMRAQMEETIKGLARDTARLNAINRAHGFPLQENPFADFTFPTVEELIASSIKNEIAAEVDRENKKETQVYSVFKLDGEVVGMYLKDGVAFTIFDDGGIQSSAQNQADRLGLTFEERDEFVSGKMAEAIQKVYGDRLEVETFGYAEDAPLAGAYSEEVFGTENRYQELANMSSKMLMHPTSWAVMVERYQ